METVSEKGKKLNTVGTQPGMAAVAFTKEHTNVAKGVAILWMLFYHLFETQALVTDLQVNTAPFTLDSFLVLSGFGNICVAIFVVLTGYGISKGIYSRWENSAPLDWMRTYKEATIRFGKLMVNFAILFLSINALWFYKFQYGACYGKGKQGVLAFITDGLGLNMFFDTPTMNQTWWYMKIAYVLIFLVPVLAFVVRKIGYASLLAAVLFPFVVVMDSDIARYFFCAVVGVCAAYGGWFEKGRTDKSWLRTGAELLGGLLVIALCILIRQNWQVYEHYVHLVDAPIALFLIVYSAKVLGRIGILRVVLAFLGKHSMNMYLVHTFFYMALWQPYIYKAKHFLLIWLVLTVVTLAYSVVLEGIKSLVKKIYVSIMRKN